MKPLKVEEEFHDLVKSAANIVKDNKILSIAYTITKYELAIGLELAGIDWKYGHNANVISIDGREPGQVITFCFNDYNKLTEIIVEG